VPTLRLYDYASSGHCYKVRLLLALLGREYERERIDIFAGDTLTDEFRRINPRRRTPVLEVAPDRYLPESMAILLFLAERSIFMPSIDSDESLWRRGQVYRWLLFEQADFGAVAGARFFRLTGRDEQAPETYAELAQTAANALRDLDQQLTQRPFVTGDDPTVADVALYGYGHVAAEAGLDIDPFPHLQRWLGDMASLDGVIHDLEPYPENARAGRGTSIYA
jgi:glutathione S-transferase